MSVISVVGICVALLTMWTGLVLLINSKIKEDKEDEA